MDFLAASRTGHITCYSTSDIAAALWRVVDAKPGWLFLFAVLMAAGLLFCMVFFVSVVFLPLLCTYLSCLVALLPWFTGETFD